LDQLIHFTIFPLYARIEHTTLASNSSLVQIEQLGLIRNVDLIMPDKYQIHLRRIDIVDKKSPIFFMLTRNITEPKFVVTRDNIEFTLSFGVTDDYLAYTDIEFEVNLDVTLDIFERQIPSVHLGSVEIVPTEAQKLKDLKNTEQNKIEEQLRDLFPLTLEALNSFRTSCRMALFRESVAGDILAQNIQLGLQNLGIPINQDLQELFEGNDTEFLFGAFVNLNLSSFSGDANIEYTVSDKSGHSITGLFSNGYKGLRSVDRFPEKLAEIQKLIDEGWTITDEVLLSSLEFLYSDNYRMAVFNAATVLELVVIQFWEDKKRDSPPFKC
jgi:hypothetical protein